MVALSVSTSARLSSLFTLSPTFLFHCTILPSVIVSLSSGMRMTVTPNCSGVTVGAAAAAATGAGAAAGAAAAGAAGAAGAPNKPEISSPSLPMMAMISFTLAALPSSTPIYRRVPSAYPTTSMVALSVSTSARLSSLFTLSPTFLFHLTIFPSVIVSLRSGILMTSAMARRYVWFFVLDYGRPKLRQKRKT